MSCPFEDLITTARSLKFRKQRDCGDSRTLIDKGLVLAVMEVDIDGKRFNLFFTTVESAVPVLVFTEWERVL